MAARCPAGGNHKGCPYNAGLVQSEASRSCLIGMLSSAELCSAPASPKYSPNAA